MTSLTGSNVMNAQEIFQMLRCSNVQHVERQASRRTEGSVPGGLLCHAIDSTVDPGGCI